MNTENVIEIININKNTVSTLYVIIQVVFICNTVNFKFIMVNIRYNIFNFKFNMVNN